MKSKYYLILSCFLLVGCSSLILNIITPNDVNNSLKVMKKGNQEVIYLPMVHVAKPEFFSQVKKIIDSLKNNGYIVYYEGIKLDKKYYKHDLDSINKQELEILLMKFRKMTGGFRATDLTSKNNKSLPKYYKKEKYISQSNQNLGIDSLDIHTDATLTELINAQEKKEGKIMLSKCDFNTGFYDKYKCETVNNYYALNSYRDSIVASKVLNQNNQKSLIVFGKKHWYGIWPYFRDTGYKLVEK